MQAYSNPKRESDPHALPDIEYWREEVAEVSCRCGEYEVSLGHVSDGEIYCPSCERKVPESAVTVTERKAWWFWYCLPGCMPDSDVRGPYATEEEALADAQEGCDD